MKLTKNKLIFILEILIVLGITFSFLPREAFLCFLGILIFYILFSPLKDGFILFVASIPIFIALPISENFDSLSSARVIILVLFLKWLFEKRKEIKNIIKKETLFILFFLILAISIFVAPDKIIAIKKFIYILNLAVIYLMAKDILQKEDVFKKTIKAVLISGATVFLIGLGQLIFVYFSTIGNFWNWWANHFSVGFYGENLKQIVLNMNAWFAYSPSGPSIIRLFGSFTDPHSFALYLLMVIPFIIYLLFPEIKDKIRKEKITKENSIWWAWLILSLFFIILSGTRGIWLSVIFGFIVSIYLLIKKLNIHKVVSFLLLIQLMFIALIPIASIFTVIPQFKEGQAQNVDAALILKRLISILDIEEQSNQGRIYIWKKSFESIKSHPFLGIGLGNFPLVLGQDIKLAKAGSSAHNLYLNFAVESGIFILIVIGLIILKTLSVIFKILKNNLLPKYRILLSAFFVFLIWIFGYSLFDIALSDERVFVLFMIILGMIYAIKNNPKFVLKK